MNINELTPEEQEVLCEISRGNGTGHPMPVLWALERLCLIEKRDGRWIVTTSATGLVLDLWAVWR